MNSILLLGFEEGTLRDAQVARVRELAPHMEILYTRDKETIRRHLDRIEIVAGSFPHDLIGDAPNLRWMQQWGAGADWLLRYPEVQESDLVLTNASGVHAVPISEHIFAYLLAFGRRLPQAFRAQEERVWVSNQWQASHSSTIRPGQSFDFYIGKDAVFELAGKVMLLVGVGAIGERTAKIAHAFDMRIVGVRRDPGQATPLVDRMVAPSQLHFELPKADYVVITAPLTAETRGLFGPEEFALMKPESYIVNIGRGEIIQEAALVEALRSGAIAGAGLDVFEEEPLPAESPLWEMPNVIITSHYAGLTPRYDERALHIFLENLRRYGKGEPLRNVVDKQIGY